MEKFSLWKQQTFEKKDKSFKGEIDIQIKELCDKINNSNNYFTLSSCSGRISLIKQTRKKEPCIWLFVTHDKIKRNILEIIKNSTEKDIDFVVEGAILHVCSKTLEDAKYLMEIAKQSGFNQVGIISFKRKIVVELIVDSNLKTPVKRNNIVLISDLMENSIIKEGNSALKHSWKCIDKLKEYF